MLHTTLGLPDASIKAAPSPIAAYEMAYELGQRAATEHMRVTGAGPISCVLFAISLLSSDLSDVERERLGNAVAKDLTLWQLQIDVPGTMNVHANWLAELKLAEQWPEEIWAGAIWGVPRDLVRRRVPRRGAAVPAHDANCASARAPDRVPRRDPQALGRPRSWHLAALAEGESRVRGVDRRDRCVGCDARR